MRVSFVNLRDNLDLTADVWPADDVRHRRHEI
jgi:hypothetical protein